MDAKLIEKLDRRRYRYALWFTIGATIMFPGQIFGPNEIENKSLDYAVGVISFIGFVLLIIFSIKMFNNEQDIKSNPELKAALNNEMVRLYNYKSAVWAACMAVFVSLFMMGLERWFIPGITVYTVCVTIYSSTFWAAMVSRLIYWKTRG